MGGDTQEDTIMNRKMVKTAGMVALSATVLLSGCGKINKDATLVTVKNGDNTETISLGYGNFAARYQQSLYDQYLLAYYGEGMWKQDLSGTGSTFEEETKDGVLKELEEQYLAKVHAADYDVKISDDQSKDIADAAKKFMSDNSEDTLKQMGATEEYVQQYLENRTYYTMVQAAAMKEADKDIKDEDCWMRSFTYVLFDTTGKKDDEGNVTDYTKDELVNLKNQAEDLAKTEDFDGDVEKLGLTPSTYSYLKGETEDTTMDMNIISAAEDLNEGDVSSVIEIDGVGYYVIRLDKDHDEDASANKRTSLQQEAFTALMESWKEDIDWKVDDKAWEKVKFDSLFKAVEKETDETSEEATEESSDKATEETTEATENTEAEEKTEEDSTSTTEDNTEEEDTEATEEN